MIQLSRSKTFPKMRLRFTLVVPFVLQIIAAVGLVGYLSFQNGQKTVEDLANQLTKEVGTRLQENILGYLDKSHHVLRVTQDGARSGNLDLTDFEKLQRYFWNVVQAGDLETYLSFGNSQGEFVGVERREDSTVQLKIRTLNTQPLREVYQLDAAGNRAKQLKQSKYDPRDRPWYRAAQQVGGPTWSPIYPFFSRQATNTALGISAVAPVFNQDQQLQGVLCINVTLLRVTEFLKTSHPSPHGQTFVIERSGNLVVSSSIPQPFKIKGQGEDAAVERIPAVSSEDALVRATAQQLQSRFGNFKAIQDSQRLKFQVGDGWYYAQALPIQDGRGIDWLAIVVVPESDFMGQVNQNTQTTIVLCFLALMLATSVGVLTARWVTRPILQVAQASQEIASGDLDQHIETEGIIELEALADSFNSMAGQLQQSFDSLAAKNEALKLSEERFRSLIFNIPGAIYRGRCDQGWAIEFISDEIEEISGYPATDFTQSLTLSLSSITHPDDRLINEITISHAILIQEPFTLEYRITHQDGSVRWLSERGQATVDENGDPLCIDGAIFDVTKRKQADEELTALKNSLARFFPSEYLKFLKKDNVTQLQLGDHVSKEMAVMFSDIRSFTSLSERMTPQEIFNFMNAYLKWVSPEIYRANGFIVKYLGDGIMAAFPDHVDDAIAAGIAKQQKVREYNQERASQGLGPIAIGIGVHVGHMMVGLIGEANRMQGDTLSDTINLTSRLEGLTKLYGVSLIISEEVRNQMSHPEQYLLRYLDRAIVQGRSESIAVYEVIDAEPDEIRALKAKTLTAFEQGIQQYHQREFLQAKQSFEQVIALHPTDKTALIYLERIHQYLQEGVPEDWSGVWAFTQK
jgi:PAS domain S-box-containing protein